MPDNKNIPILCFCLIVLLSIITMYYFFYQLPLLLDENLHFYEIVSFAESNHGLGGATMIPTYHWLTAALSKISGDHSIQGLRFASLIFPALFAAAIYWTSLAAQPGQYYLRALQIFFLPLVFPFIPLLYTDISALIFPVISLGFYLRKNLWAAALAACIGLFFRQTNIIWFLMLYAMIYHDRHGCRVTLYSIKSHVLSNPVFLIGFLLTVFFLISNNGFSMGVFKKDHTINGVYFGNLFFFFCLFFIIFFPLIALRIKPLMAQVFEKKWLLLSGILFLISYWVLFRITHEWNYDWNLLRNAFLLTLFINPVIFILSAVPCLLAFWFLLTTPLISPSARAIYPFSALILITISLIEPRYHMMSFIMFILFYQSYGHKIERIQLFWLVFLSIGLVWGHQREWFFL